MSIQKQARSLMMRHHQKIRNREQSMLNRLAAEIGIDINTQYHSHIQGKTIHDFRVAYDRSNAAMS
jgi:glucuronate isomerase